MIFIKTFKGYEDKTLALDMVLNEWVRKHEVDVVDVKTTLAHETGGRSMSGDLIYTVLYKGDGPID